MICSYWGDTHIYQEGSISPPCMVLVQSEQQEESVYFLSMERRCVPRRSPKAVNHSQSRFRFIRFALTKKKHASHHLKWFLIWACVRYTRQSMRKYKAQSRVTAEKCHKSSCLSSCIFKAECSQWLWVLAARPSVILQRESKPTVEITPTVMPGRSWGHQAWYLLQDGKVILTELIISSQLTWQLPVYTYPLGKATRDDMLGNTIPNARSLSLCYTHSQSSLLLSLSPSVLQLWLQLLSSPLAQMQVEPTPVVRINTNYMS